MRTARLALLGCTLVACSSPSATDGQEVVGRAEQRIVGGTTVAPSTTNAVLLEGRCSGTLLSPLWVLTAGHCFFNQTELGSPWSFRVSLGEHSVRVTEILMHPQYQNVDVIQGPRNDVALLRLAAPGLTGAQPRVELTYRRNAEFARDPRPLVRCYGYGAGTVNGNDFGTLRWMDNVVTFVDQGWWFRWVPVGFYPNPSGQHWWFGDSGGGCVTLDTPAAELMTVISGGGTGLNIGMSADDFRTMIDTRADTHLVKSEATGRCLSLATGTTVGMAGCNQKDFPPPDTWRFVQQPGSPDFEIRNLHAAGPTGQCLRAGTDFTIVVGRCDGADASEWSPIPFVSVPSGDTGFRFVNRGFGTCLESTATGLRQASCEGSPAQRFMVGISRFGAQEQTSFRQTIRSKQPGAKRCLGFPWPLASGSHMQLTECSSSLGDNFVYRYAGMVAERILLSSAPVSGAGSRCIAPENHEGSDGTRIVAEECTTDDHQVVQRIGLVDRRIRFVRSQKCLSLRANTFVGDDLTLQTCGAPGFEQDFMPF